MASDYLTTATGKRPCRRCVQARWPTMTIVEFVRRVTSAHRVQTKASRVKTVLLLLKNRPHTSLSVPVRHIVVLTDNVEGDFDALHRLTPRRSSVITFYQPVRRSYQPSSLLSERSEPSLKTRLVKSAFRFNIVSASSLPVHSHSHAPSRRQTTAAEWCWGATAKRRRRRPTGDDALVAVQDPSEQSRRRRSDADGSGGSVLSSVREGRDDDRRRHRVVARVVTRQTAHGRHTSLAGWLRWHFVQRHLWSSRPGRFLRPDGRRSHRTTDVLELGPCPVAWRPAARRIRLGPRVWSHHDQRWLTSRVIINFFFFTYILGDVFMLLFVLWKYCVTSRTRFWTSLIT